MKTYILSHVVSMFFCQCPPPQAYVYSFAYGCMFCPPKVPLKPKRKSNQVFMNQVMGARNLTPGCNRRGRYLLGSMTNNIWHGNLCSLLDITVQLMWWHFGNGEEDAFSKVDVPNSVPNVDFDNEQDYHKSFENYEESGYGHNLDLLIISHKLCVLYTTRSGYMEKIVRLTLAYLRSKSLSSFTINLSHKS